MCQGWWVKGEATLIKQSHGKDTMSLDSFMSKFGESDVPGAVVGLSEQWAATQAPGALDKFIDKFQGVTEPYFFYYVDGVPTVELRFQVEEHIYYRVGELGQLTPQDGVTTICHIIDKSTALVPWSAKMVAQKVLRTIPVVLVPFYKDEPTKRVPLTGPIPEDAVMGYVIADLTQEAFEKIILEAKSAPRDKLEEAGEVGHMAHTWLEYFIKAILAKDVAEQQKKLATMPADERARNGVMAALGWMHSHNVRWIETERKIYSKKYSYAGTMDGLCRVDSCDDPTCCPTPFKDRLTVADWKTSNYLYIEYLYQTAAYEAAYEEEFGVDIQDRWILRLGKEDGEFEPWHTTEEDFQEDFEGFLDALSLTRSVHLTEERMKGQKKAIREAKKAVKEAKKEADKAAAKIVKAQVIAERRAKKALEKEETKTKKKAERAALKLAGKAQVVKVEEDDSTVGETTQPIVAAPISEEFTELVTVDMAEIEQRVIADLVAMPEEKIVVYGIQLPPEV